MDLVTRGRLSVQRVGEDAWAAIALLAENGGWEELDMRPKKKVGKAKGSTSKIDKPEKGEETQEKDRTDNEAESKDEQVHIGNTSTKRKRRTDVDIGDIGERPGLRRSNRAKK
jgi:hypothetical protein